MGNQRPSDDPLENMLNGIESIFDDIKFEDIKKRTENQDKS